LSKTAHVFDLQPFAGFDSYFPPYSPEFPGGAFIGRLMKARRAQFWPTAFSSERYESSFAPLLFRRFLFFLFYLFDLPLPTTLEFCFAPA